MMGLFYILFWMFLFIYLIGVVMSDFVFEMISLFGFWVLLFVMMIFVFVILDIKGLIGVILDVGKI